MSFLYCFSNLSLWFDCISTSFLWWMCILFLLSHSNIWRDLSCILIASSSCFWTRVSKRSLLASMINLLLRVRSWSFLRTHCSWEIYLALAWSSRILATSVCFVGLSAVPSSKVTCLVSSLILLYTSSFTSAFVLAGPPSWDILTIWSVFAVSSYRMLY